MDVIIYPCPNLTSCKVKEVLVLALCFINLLPAMDLFINETCARFGPLDGIHHLVYIGYTIIMINTCCFHISQQILCAFILILHVGMFLDPTWRLGDITCIHKSNNDLVLNYRLPIMLSAKFIVMFGLCISKSNSCLVYEMYEGKPGGPMYYQQYGPTDAGQHLFDCARWCIGVAICKSIVWEQGVCAQVGLAGTGQWVTGNIFIPKRPSVLPGELELKQSSYYMTF